MKRMNNRGNAFTLVEMLVVLGMISILMGVTFTGVGKARTQARIVKANAEIRELMNAWLAYEAAYDDWPASIEGDELEASESNLGELLGKNETEAVFLDAQLVNGFFRDPWGTPYRFRIMKERGENRATDGFGAAIAFPNRHRPAVPARAQN
jgi:prepilin-type N-terminal cleavage/methylation domain-containing protein